LARLLWSALLLRFHHPSSASLFLARWFWYFHMHPLVRLLRSTVITWSNFLVTSLWYQIDRNLFQYIYPKWYCGRRPQDNRGKRNVTVRWLPNWPVPINGTGGRTRECQAEVVDTARNYI
jgi:hypothetical protein